MPCWAPRRSFPRSLREWYKVITSFEESNYYFFSKCSFGHDECSDYNLGEEFSTKSWKFFAQSTKLVKKRIFHENGLHKDPIVSVNAVLTTSPKLPLQFPWRIKSLYFFRKIHFLFFLNTSPWTQRMNWLKLCWRGFDERPPEMFRSRWKNGKNTYIFKKTDLHRDPIASVNAALTTTPKLSSQSPRIVSNFNVFRRIKFLFFLIMFLWTRRMQWLQSRRRVSNEKLKMFRSKYKIGKKNVFFKKTVCIEILLSQWMQCWPPRRNFPCSFREGWKVGTFFEKSIFYFCQYVPMDTMNALITTLLTRFRRKPPEMFRSRWKNGKKIYFLKKWSA